MNSESTAITFLRDPYGIVHVAGSGNYNFNPSISVPENYLNPNAVDTEYYFQKYNNLLTEDGIKKMNVSEATATELRKLNDAVENTKRLAEAEALAGNTNAKPYQHGDGIVEYTFVLNHSVSNCGEIWSAREAILNGAKFDELDLSTYCNNGTEKYDVGDYMPKCENCQHTFGGN